MKIHKDCWGTIVWIWALCIALICISLIFIDNHFISYPLAGIFLFFLCFVLFFFRVPERECKEGENVVTSAADGKIVIIEKVFEKEYLKDECIQVSVYMDFFNVHVNFWPLGGNVTYYKYHPGKYFFAFLPKASELNEHTSIALKNDSGEVFFRQIAGTFARRIKCYAKEGSKETKGTQCGIIKFGSRVDMFLPLDAEILVKLGDEVRACETVIAKL